MTDIRIYKAKTERDLRLLRGLDDLVFPDDSPEDIKLNENNHWWLAFQSGEPVASGGISHYSGSVWFLCRAGVLPQARGQGLQKRLIRKRLAWARANDVSRVITYTMWDNVPSMKSLVRAGLAPYHADYTYGTLWFERSLAT